ncbi:serine acetyltransferase [Corallincola holothuriorum]|uniref:Serine acetyltransferase n=1 Tax=Corallincola holothuriorum TaxID=2282215 RepID=A0A368NIA6_9GAMM|nr:serine acetyltransferase [Corallincola holothuriorum]RCU49465.1 serine acetyltransferase [Corallincola holothuriorum]
MSALKRDVERYGGWRSLFREQSLYSVLLYRLGCRIDSISNSLLRRLACLFYFPIYRLFETLTGISIPKEVDIGGGLRIWHFGQIFIHPKVVIGENCTLRQGVTLGNRRSDDDVPVIGNNVEFGANCIVIGSVTIGDNVKIGPMSLVLDDLPDNAVAVGNPAKIVRIRKQD